MTPSKSLLVSFYFIHQLLLFYAPAHAFDLGIQANTRLSLVIQFSCSFPAILLSTCTYECFYVYTYSFGFWSLSVLLVFLMIRFNVSDGTICQSLLQGKHCSRTCESSFCSGMFSSKRSPLLHQLPCITNSFILLCIYFQDTQYNPNLIFPFPKNNYFHQKRFKICDRSAKTKSTAKKGVLPESYQKVN